MLPARRARYLHVIADRLEAASEQIAQLQTLNVGKPLAETRALAASALGTFRYYAAVLVKPATRAPLVSLALGRAPMGAGLPAGFCPVA